MSVLSRLPRYFPARLLLLLCAIGWLTACGGKAEREAAHLERGIGLYDQGDLDKARLELKTVRQINPRNVQALYYLALIDRAQQDWQSAFINLSEATEIQPDYLPAQLQLAEFQFLSEQFDGLFATLDRIETLDPGNASAAALRGAVYLRQDKLDLAIKEAKAALATDPHHPTGVPLLVGIRLRQNRPDDALKIVDTAIAADPGSIALRQLKVALLQRIGRAEDAVEVLSSLIELEPTVPGHRVALARLLISAKRLDEAEKVLYDYISTETNSDDAKLLLIDFLANQRGLESAEQKIAEFSQDSANQALYLLTLSRLYDKFEQPDRAKEVLARVLEMNAPTGTAIAAHGQLAAYALKDGETEKAADHINRILSIERENATGLTMRAQLQLNKGEADAAIIDLRTVLRNNPDSIEALRVLGTAYARKGDLQLATETFDELSQLLPEDAQTLIELASLHASQNALDTALTLVDRALAAQPGLMIALRLRGDILLRKQRPGDAKAISQQIIAANPDSAEGYGLKGLAELQLGETEAALASLLKSYTLSPDLDGLSRLVSAYTRIGGTKMTKTFLTDEIRAGRNTAAAYAHLGRVYFDEKDYERADEAFARAAAAQNGWTAPYTLQAQLYTDAGQKDRALAAIEAGLAQSPEDTQLRFIRANLLADLGRGEEAATVYEALLDTEIGERAANNLANLLTGGHGGLKPDVARAAGLADRFRDTENPYLLDTRGWILFKSGDTSEALIVLTKSVQYGATFPDVYYHLGALHAELGNRALAISNLKTALEMKKEFADKEEARRLLVKLTSANGE